jgi:O-acetyl-ADP-ribose deacetylase (regulator of RNase III)
MELHIGTGKVLRLMQGDITKVAVDAICNAANSGLRGGGGVDGAIHRAGGPSIMKELDVIRRDQGGCPTGSAVATGAGNLPAKYVFHAVGPVWRGGGQNEAELLASAYRTCMKLAEQRGVERISFPSISTGVYGFPVDQAAPVALRTVSDELTKSKTVREAIFVLFDVNTLAAYESAMAALKSKS